MEAVRVDRRKLALKIEKKLLKFIVKQKSKDAFKKYFNIFAKTSRSLKGRRGWQVCVTDFEELLHLKDVAGDEIAIVHQNRIGFYKFGVKGRSDGLLKDYFIDVDDIDDGEIVLDCGANIGEVGVGFRLQNKHIRYIAFEPSIKEYEACKENNPGSVCENLALWHEKTTLTFYEKANSADSSLIEFSGYVSKTEVETTTLDDYCRKNDIRKIKILKIEGEGAEPEILRGADDILQNTKYVCVDCGPERGLARQSTLPEVATYLLSKNFVFKDIQPGRLTAIFENPEY